MQSDVDRGSAGLEAARRLAPQLRERALEGEQLRTMPKDLAEECGRAGLFRLGLPASLGGLGLSPAEALPVIETCAHADGSAGWTIMIGNTTSFVGWLERPAAEELLSISPTTAAAGVLGPIGRAEELPDGSFRVSGRWPFNSGAAHSSFFTMGVMVLEDGKPRMLEYGPDARLAYLTADQVEILDTWHVAGLKGTGSHDVTVDGAIVPPERMAAPFMEPARQPETIYRLPFWNLLTGFMVGWPIGIARRALEEFAAVAQRKSRSRDGARLADETSIQIEFAGHNAAVRAARAFAEQTYGAVWDTLAAGQPVTLEDRSRMTGATLNAMRTAVAAVDFAFHRAGGGALYDDSALQRCFRDVHAAGQHILFSQDTFKRLGGVDLGVDELGIMV